MYDKYSTVENFRPPIPNSLLSHRCHNRVVKDGAVVKKSRKGHECRNFKKKMIHLYRDGVISQQEASHRCTSIVSSISTLLLVVTRYLLAVAHRRKDEDLRPLLFSFL